MAIASFLLATGISPVRAAGEIFDSAGFEALSTGPLQGQLADGNLWMTVGSGGSSATVEAGAGADGSQAVRVDRGARSDDWWAVSYSGTGLPNDRYVVVDWDMKVDLTGANAGVFGPFFGIQAFDDTMPSQLLGSLGVDATTRDVLFQAPDTGVLVETGLTVDDGWHHYQLRLDFDADQYQVSVDYDYPDLGAIPFVDGPAITFADADIAALAAGADNFSQRQTGTAYFDNYVISSTAGLPGDYNDDGEVNLADYTVWRDHLGATAGSLPNDVDGGLIGQPQYATWKANLGHAPPVLVVAAGQTVPEPSTCLLAMGMAASILAYRRTT